jgi:hypothetical protein
MPTTDHRLTAASNFLATAPESDFSRLLRGVIDIVNDALDTELDQSVTQVLDDGGVYLCPEDVLRLCPDCLNRAIKSVTVS